MSHQPPQLSPALPRLALLLPASKPGQNKQTKQEITAKNGEHKTLHNPHLGNRQTINKSVPVSSAGCGQLQQNGCCALKGSCTPVVFNSQHTIKHGIKGQSLAMQAEKKKKKATN